MHPALVPAALTLTASAAMAAYVAFRRDKGILHWLFLGTILGTAVWTTGTTVRLSVASEEGLRTGVHLVFFGILLTAQFWLLLAARSTRARFVSQPAPLVALLVPGALLGLALLTNDAHRLLIRENTFRAMQAGPPAFAGPLFWVFIAWVYGFVAAGIVLYLRAARRLVAGEDARRRGLLLTAAAVVPLVSSTFYVFQWIPIDFDLTPSGLTISMVLLWLATLRYQLLESLPVARRDLIARLDEGVVTAGPGGRVVGMNPAAERILAVTRSSARGRPVAELLAGLGRPADRTAVLGAVRGLLEGDDGLDLELAGTDERRIELSGARVRDGDGAPIGGFAILRDRTEEHRFERIARQTQKLETVGALAAGIAHEVNDPLAFVRSNLGEIGRLGALVEEQHEGADGELAADLAELRSIALETLDGVGRIGRIVADMRRLSAGRQESAAPVDAADLVRDALRLARLGENSTPPVSLALEHGLPRIWGSAERLVQVLLNLLSNARQALAGLPDGRIRVAISAVGADLEIAVDDNGPGVPDTVQERIFDPFFTTKGPDAGMGLGLAIAFDIVNEHGGVLEERRRPGPGACFVLRLPGEGAASAPSAGAGREVEIQHGE